MNDGNGLRERTGGEGAEGRGTPRLHSEYNPKSAITVRLFTWGEEEPEEVLARRLEETARWKGRLYGDTYRWIFAEGDLVPGLVIDVEGSEKDCHK